MTTLLPISVVAFALGIDDREARRLASQGHFGPITHPPGCKRKRLLHREEVELRAGRIHDDKLADAWARYKRGEHIPASAVRYRNVRAGGDHG